MDKFWKGYAVGVLLTAFVIWIVGAIVWSGIRDESVATCNAEWEHRMVDLGHAVYIDLDGDTKGDVFHMLATDLCGRAPSDVLPLAY